MQQVNSNIAGVQNVIEKNKYGLEKIISRLRDIDGKAITPAFVITDDTKKTLTAIQERLATWDKKIINPIVQITGGEDSKLKPIQEKLIWLNQKFSPVIELAGGITGELAFISEKISKLKASDFDMFKKMGSSGVKAFNSVKESLSSLSLGLNLMKVKTTAAAIAQSILNGTLFANPITWIVIGIVALIAAIVLMIKHWDKVKDVISGVVNWFRNVFSSIGNWFTKHWKTIATVILLIMGPIGWAILALIRVVRQNLDNIKNTAMQVWSTITNFLAMTWSRLENIITIVWNSISGFFNGIWNSIKSSAQSCWTSIGNFISGIGTSIQNIWNSVMEWISQKIGWIKTVFNDIMNNPVFKFISNTANGVINIVSTGISLIRDNVFGENPQINSSNASGLSYVPFDGYIAELHKGERVLTASENRVYNNLASENRVYNNSVRSLSQVTSKGGNVFNISINGVNKSSDEIINDLVQKIKEAANTMGEVAIA